MANCKQIKGFSNSEHSCKDRMITSQLSNYSNAFCHCLLSFSVHHPL